MSQDDPMSRSNNNTELLSAYHDGEVSADERAAAEQLMTDSPDARQTLDEFGQLSQSLKELHGSAQSPDLHDRVMAQIAAGPTSPAPSTITAGRRRVFSIFAGIAGLAAAVMMLVWATQPGPQLDQAIATNEAAKVADGERLESFDVTGTSSSPDAHAEGIALRAARPEPAAAEVSSAPAEMSMARVRSAATKAMEANVALSLEEMTRERKLPEVGDIVGYLDQNAEELTWVAVTVVDVQTAGSQVQLLLTKHGVEPPQAVEQADGDRPAEDAQRPDEPMTILVESEWDQMEAIIVDLSDAGFVNTLVVDAPDDEGVPAVLQGYAITRDGGQLIDDANDSGRRLKEQVRERNALDGALAAEETSEAIGGRKPESIGNAIQLRAMVPDRELRRMAAKRGVEGVQLAEDGTSSVENAEPVEESESSTVTEKIPEKTTGIGAPLAHPRRGKFIIVIQKSGQ